MALLGGLTRWQNIPGLFWRSLTFVLAAGIVFVVVTQWNRWEGEARHQTTDDAYLQAYFDGLAQEMAA